MTVPAHGVAMRFPSPLRTGNREADARQGRRRRPQSGFPCGASGASGSGTLRAAYAIRARSLTFPREPPRQILRYDDPVIALVSHCCSCSACSYAGQLRPAPGGQPTADGRTKDAGDARRQIMWGQASREATRRMTSSIRPRPRRIRRLRQRPRSRGDGGAAGCRMDLSPLFRILRQPGAIPSPLVE